MKTYILVILMTFLTMNSFAKGVKYGKYSKEEILLQECPYETDAVAVILSETCVVDLSYAMIYYKHHVRIKILKEEGLKYANVELPFYRKNNLEKISGVRGQTVYFHENGKKEVTNLSSKTVFTVDEDENYGEVRFSMPNVKVGSIIEYKYTTNSKFYNYLDTWYFQSEIPTHYSSIKVNMPDTFRYDMLMFGDRLERKYSTEKTNMWTLNHLPSIKEEEYINNYRDFVEQIRFQLTGYYKSAAQGPEFVTTLTSWEKLASEYMSNIDFLGRKAFAKKQVEQILDGSENNWEKIQKIYDYVRLNVKWDGKLRIYPKKSAPKILEEQTANSAEMNFLLVLMLREAGLKVNPALARTNDRGLMQIKYPLMSQFNQVLACVEVFGKKVFLNAVSKFRPYDLLAVRDLNFRAFVLDKKSPQWEKIVPFDRNRQNILVEYNLTDIENPTCKFASQESGYYAASSRSRLANGQKENWLKRYINITELDIDEDIIELENEEDVNKPLKGEASFPIGEDWDLNSELIYLTPFPAQVRKNPFLAETRQYKIDFNYKRSQTINVKIILPKECSVEDFPQSKAITLPNDGGKFTLASRVSGNELQMRAYYSINKPNFSKDYYPYLRAFFSEISTLLNAQVVIKKNQNISGK